MLSGLLLSKEIFSAVEFLKFSNRTLGSGVWKEKNIQFNATQTEHKAFGKFKFLKTRCRCLPWWRTHVISAQLDIFWSFATIFSAAAFFAAFFEFATAVKKIGEHKKDEQLKIVDDLKWYADKFTKWNDFQWNYAWTSSLTLFFGSSHLVPTYFPPKSHNILYNRRTITLNPLTKPADKRAYPSLTGTPFDRWQWTLFCVVDPLPLELCILEIAILSARRAPEMTATWGQQKGRTFVTRKKRERAPSVSRDPVTCSTPTELGRLFGSATSPLLSLFTGTFLLGITSR